MEIPQITVDSFPFKVQEDLKWAYGSISDVDLANKIAELNISAENHIKTSISNPNLLKTEDWKVLKEPFIAWQLYSKLEKESITRDKREDYYMLIDSINRKQKDSSSPTDLEEVSRGIMVF